MEILSGIWASLALLLRPSVTKTDKEMDGFLPVCFGLLLFLPTFALLLQLVVYSHWKLKQVEAELAVFSKNHSAIYSPNQEKN